MRRALPWMFVSLWVTLWAPLAQGAYHHEGEQDSGQFLAAYPAAANSKLDSCALCHTGGSYLSSGKTVTLGSCQWCHYAYGLDGTGDIALTLNPYGSAYLGAGRSAAAVTAVDNLDSDGDTYTNRVEILAARFPGNASDDPSKTPAPSRVYTRAQIEAMTPHSQFLLMNATRSTDSYAEYKGIVLGDLLQSVINSDSTGIVAYAPDGFSYSYPLDEVSTAGVYHVRGTYPEATYYYDAAATWCDYTAASALGRSNGDPIVVSGGLKFLLAYKRDGAYLAPGVLTSANKLDGEGPFRIVPPQKTPSAPDQSSNNSNSSLIWPYNAAWDHNAGASARSATMIKVLPLPVGTTDIDALEAGWNYIDEGKIVIYGNLNASDSNGNGIFDSEEGTGDLNGDGIPDAQDTKTASFNNPAGAGKVGIASSAGDLASVKALTMTDPAVPLTGRPKKKDFPYGAQQFQIVGLTVGQSVAVTLTYPEALPTGTKYYKVDHAGVWREVPSTRLGNQLTVTLTDGDPVTDSDGAANGVIVDPGAVATPASDGGSGDSGGLCFVQMAADSAAAGGPLALVVLGVVGVLWVSRRRR